MFRWHLALEGDAVLDQGAEDKLFEPYARTLTVPQSDVRLWPGRACRGKHPPQSAVEPHVVTEDLARPLMRIGVERSAAVGNLAVAIAAARGPQQVGFDAAPGLRAALGEDRGPGLGTAPIAARPVSGVRLEHVDGLGARCPDHPAEVRVAGADPSPVARRGHRRWRREGEPEHGDPAEHQSPPHASGSPSAPTTHQKPPLRSTLWQRTSPGPSWA